MQTNDYSIYKPNAACKNHNSNTKSINCCAKAKNSCCSVANNLAKDDDCCINNTILFKLDTKTVFNHSNISLKCNNEIHLNYSFFKLLILANDNLKPLFAFNTNDGPPPLPVWQFLAHIQVYLI
jgi:hypothetical protein